MKKKIGILSCANMAEHGKCATAGCIHAFNNNIDNFTEYAENGAELLGITHCSGCPTALAPERITQNLSTLITMGMERLHISSCILGFCPFKNKYINAIKTKFPNLEISEGTHFLPPEEAKIFRKGMKNVLTSSNKTVLDFINHPV